jgi:ribosomal protein L20A (L18A)
MEKNTQRFEVAGMFRNAKGDHAFTKIVSADSEKRAGEKTLALLGSHHRVSRRRIQITSIKIATKKGSP